MLITLKSFTKLYCLDFLFANSTSVIFANVFNIFIASHTWISPSLRGDGPEAREGHSAALVGKRLFVFGGCGKSTNNNVEIYYNDLYILNTGNFSI
jgi:hypothetical protein